MDVKRFLSLIDLHSRGLEDALRLQNAGNDDAAANAVIEVLKKRLSAIPDGISPADEKTMEGADALLENRLSLDELECIATEKLGMHRPTSAQLFFSMTAG